METPSSNMIEDFLRGFGQDTQSLMEAYPRGRKLKKNK